MHIVSLSQMVTRCMGHLTGIALLLSSTCTGYEGALVVPGKPNARYIKKVQRIYRMKPIHHYAACNDNNGVVRWCRHSKRACEMQDIHGRTPLHYAQTPEMVHKLLSLGASSVAADVWNQTPYGRVMTVYAYARMRRDEADSKRCQALVDAFIRRGAAYIRSDDATVDITYNKRGKIAHMSLKKWARGPVATYGHYADMRRYHYAHCV